MGNWIDVTRVLEDGMTGWPGDPPFRLHRVSVAADTCRVSEICMSAHIGTHVDAPLHCVPGGGDVAQISLERLCGPAILLDVAARQQVIAEDLDMAPIRPGDRVLLRTGPRFTAVSTDAAQQLVDRGVVLVGLSAASPDPANAADLTVHRILLGADVPILENLDLDNLHPGRYEMVALPLIIRGAEGSPARVILRPLGEGVS